MRGGRGEAGGEGEVRWRHLLVVVGAVVLRRVEGEGGVNRDGGRGWWLLHLVCQ